MAFTIEEAVLFTKDLYKIKFVAGKNGLLNQISWVHLLEDTTIINQFWGNELAITTGLGFPSEDKLLHLVRRLVEHNSAGIIINIGKYIHEIPKSVISYCNDNDLPLLTVPWEINIADLIKDFCVRTFSSQKDDQKMIRILTNIFKSRMIKDSALSDLNLLFDSKKGGVVFYITFPFMEDIDYMEKRKVIFQLQSFLDKELFLNLLFPFENAYVLLLTSIEQTNLRKIQTKLTNILQVLIPEKNFYIGCSNYFIRSNYILTAFDYAKAASMIASHDAVHLIDFSDAGMKRLWYSFTDKELLKELYLQFLSPVIQYDMAHDSNYLETLFYYIQYNGSIQMVAQKLYTHRNTIQYRINKIKDLLQCDLSNATDRFNYQLAFYIMNSLKE